MLSNGSCESMESRGKRLGPSPFGSGEAKAHIQARIAAPLCDLRLSPSRRVAPLPPDCEMTWWRAVELASRLPASFAWTGLAWPLRRQTDSATNKPEGREGEREKLTATSQVVTLDRHRWSGLRASSERNWDAASWQSQDCSPLSPYQIYNLPFADDHFPSPYFVLCTKFLVSCVFLHARMITATTQHVGHSASMSSLHVSASLLVAMLRRCDTNEANWTFVSRHTSCAVPPISEEH